MQVVFLSSLNKRRHEFSSFLPGLIPFNIMFSGPTHFVTHDRISLFFFECLLILAIGNSAPVSTGVQTSPLYDGLLSFHSYPEVRQIDPVVDLVLVFERISCAQ